MQNRKRVEFEDIPCGRLISGYGLFMYELSGYISKATVQYVYYNITLFVNYELQVLFLNFVYC